MGSINNMMSGEPEPQQSVKGHLERRVFDIPFDQDQNKGTSTTTILCADWAVVVAAYDTTREAVFATNRSTTNHVAQASENEGELEGRDLILCLPLDHESTVAEYLRSTALQITQQVKGGKIVGMPDMSTVLDMQAMKPVNGVATRLIVQDSGSTSSAKPDTWLADNGQELLGIDCRCIRIPESHSTRIEVHYDRLNASGERAQSMLSLFQHVVCRLAAAAPHETIRDLNLVSPYVVEQYNQINSAMPEAVERNLFSFVDEWAQKTPDATAMDGADGPLTYREVSALSTALAKHLQADTRWIGTGRPVLLSFQPSQVAIVTMLAVMKCGVVCAWVNPAHPIARIAEMGEDISAQLILCGTELTAKFQQFGLPVIDVNRSLLDELLTRNQDELINPGEEQVSGPTSVQADDAAIIIFTSGSTGKPKGTLLSHRALATGLSGASTRGMITSESRVLQFASYTFDVSMLDIFGAFIQGACICVVSTKEKLNRLGEAMQEYGVTWACLTRSVLQLLKPEMVPSLQGLLLTGEMNSQEDIDLWSRHTHLFNGYGVSESTTIQLMNAKPLLPTTHRANIGTAVGCSVWISDLGNPNCLVPLGCVGEITVEGPTLGERYINNPEATARAWINDPEWSHVDCKPGHQRRFFRSGDLGWMAADGSVHILGRADDQVKINGQRVELGEIETRLKQCGAELKDICVDLLRRDGAPDLLVAYCVLEGAQYINLTGPPPTTDLMDTETQDRLRSYRESLREHLPSYMVPDLFVPIQKFPTSPSGKLDKRSLRAWVLALTPGQLAVLQLSDRQGENPEIMQDKRAPTTNLEKHLQDIWARVLGVAPADIHAESNFYRLGGDSLAAMKATALGREERLPITVADISKLPVLELLAGQLSSNMPSSPDSALGSDMESASLSSHSAEPFSLVKHLEDLPETVSQAAKDCNIPADMIEDMYPCHPTQEALMGASSHRMGAYVRHEIVKLPQTISPKRFMDAWTELVGRHAILRTRIVFKTGVGALQVVFRPDHYSTASPLVSITSAKSPPDVAEMRERLPIMYGQPLSRFNLVQVEDGSNWFTVSWHHSIYDAWSLTIMFRELASLLQGTGALDVHERVEYRDFIDYEQRTANRDEAESFWRQQFPHMIEPYPLEPYKSPGAVTVIQKLEKTFPVKHRAESGVTISTVLQAAWAILLSAYSGNDEIVCGVTLSGRDTPVHGIEEIVGPALSTTPLRVKLRGDDPVNTFLQKIQSTVAGISRYQHLGAHQIATLSPESKLACDFKSMITVQSQSSAGIYRPLQELAFGDFQIYESDAEESVLGAECFLEPGAVRLGIFHDVDFVQDDQVHVMLDQFAHIVKTLEEEAAKADQSKLCDLNFVSSMEVEQMHRWNNQLLASPMQATLHGLFEEQVRKTPDAIATCGFDGECTYSEVHDAADRLAHKLRVLGAGPEKRVVLCFSKSTWALIATLAVLKSGSVCVPLNFEHPAKRQQGICEEVEAIAVLCSAEQRPTFFGVVPHVVVVNAELLESSANNEPVDYADDQKPATLSAGPRNAAFIMYTSGSTGKPKGVVLEHHSLCLSMVTYAQSMDVNSDTRTVQFAAYSFDCHLLEVFGTWVRGGTVCVISDYERMHNLTEAINARKATRMCQTPTVVQMVDPEQTPSMDALVLGAEPLTSSVIDRWGPHARLIQHYAPVETSNLGCANLSLGIHKDPTNIGHAWGCAAWIVDKRNPNHLAPIGCIGEILLEGQNLAREYLKRPEATSAAFVENLDWAADKWSSSSDNETQQDHSINLPTRRFYRTGDMGCLQPDGTIKFIGRIDTQVKINGQRVELTEVEYQILQRLPTKSESVVEIVKLRSVATLVAFIKLPSFSRDQNTGLQTNNQTDLAVFRSITRALETSLPETLPHYMIPTLYVPVTYMPVSASLKIERKVLRKLAEEMPEEMLMALSTGTEGTIKKMPTTTTEAILQQVWAQILNHGVQSIGVDDSFMFLGGDSITAMQVVAECRRQGLQVQVPIILRNKTIAAIAPHCQVTAATGLLAKRTSVSKDDVSFQPSPTQKLYFDGGVARLPAFTQSFLHRIVDPAVTLDRLHAATDHIVRYHAMLRARYTLVQSGKSHEWTQRTIKFDSEVHRFQAHRIATMDNSHVQPIVERAHSLIDPEMGPVFSVDYFEVESGDDAIYMVAHHLVIDLVSWRSIWTDLRTVLDSGSIELSDSVTYQDWVSLQSQHFSSPSIDSRSIYPKAIPATGFEYWGVRKDDNICQFTETITFRVDTATTSGLLGSANRAMRTSVTDILVGLIAHSFQSIFTDRDCPSVFIEHHGRETPEDINGNSNDLDLSRTVGWFTSVYPVHVPATSARQVLEAIRSVKDDRKAIPKNGQPYFACSQLSPVGKTFAQHTPAEILINFAGQFQQLESENSWMQIENRVELPDNQDWDDELSRFALIDFAVGVSAGEMVFSVHLHKEMAHKDKVHKWISEFKHLIPSTVSLLKAQTPLFTMSDFPLLGVTSQELKQISEVKLPQLGLQHPRDVVLDILPCTAMQEGILLSQQREERLYHFEHVWEFLETSPLKGNRLLEAVKHAWEATTHRHAALRTGILEYNTDHGNFMQVVLKSIHDSRFRVHDSTLSSMEEIRLISKSHQKANNDIYLHIPLFTVYHLTNGMIACAVTLSHALIDGSSLDILMTEMLERVVSWSSQGSERPSFAPLPSLAEYVKYERALPLRGSLEYWGKTLKGVTPTHIPTSRLHIENQGDHESTGGADGRSTDQHRIINLPSSASNGLSSFCRKLGITPASLVQAAWAIVLSVLIGQDDVCFGYLSSTRDTPVEGIEDSIGLYISMQVCRVEMGSKTVEELLSEVHNNVITALRHRNCSLAQIQGASGAKVVPLFNTCLTIRRGMEETIRDQRSRLINVMDQAESTEFSVSLYALLGSGDAELSITYATQLISAASATTIAGTLERVIQGLINGKGRKVSDLEVVGTRDLCLMNQWNPPQLPVEATLHSLFEAQARLHTDKMAISGFDTSYTYAELDLTTNRLASVLGTLGVVAESRIVLCFAKSSMPIIAMLAVLKAGGACVSVNSDHPDARVLEICEDVGARVVLCDERHVGRFTGQVEHAVAVNQQLLDSIHLPENWVAPMVKPSNSAFIVYTSGSTGKPKGCLLRHHSVSKSQLVNAKAMKIGSTTRAVQFAAYTFDASICEIFAPLVVGGCVCVISESERLNDLAKAIRDREADWIMLTPTVAQLFSPDEVPGLRTLVFGGEALTRKALEVWCGRVHLVNYWGPSEAANSGLLNDQITAETDSMNIGRASGCNIWITDINNPHRLLPVGCVGELMIEGPMLGMGYIQRLEATAQAFVSGLRWAEDREDSFSSALVQERRFYRTGDLGRFQPDGCVTFMGRADNQVKIHGQRVELNEVQHHLTVNLPDQSEVIIDLLQIGGQASKTLVAFIKLAQFCSSPDQDQDISQDTAKNTPEDGLEVSNESHRRHFAAIIGKLEEALAKVLPLYMIPSAYVPIRRVPVTPSAKTDRKVLRALAGSLSRDVAFMRDSTSIYRPPRNEIEKDLQRIFAKVLNRQLYEIGIDDKFTNLGGDSISAMKVTAQCRKAGIHVSVSTILQEKTISRISRHCNRDAPDEEPWLASDNNDGVLFDLSPIQRQFFKQGNACDSDANHWSRYNLSIMFRLRTRPSVTEVNAALGGIVNHHAMLRARFSKDEHNCWRQRTMPPQEFGRGTELYRFRDHQFEALDEDHISRLAEEADMALDIVQGPVFSADLFQIANQDSVLYMTAHHLVMDIVSWQIIMQDLSEALKTGQIAYKPTISFQQWCALQQNEVKTASPDPKCLLPWTVPPSQYSYWGVPLEANVDEHTYDEVLEIPEEITSQILTQSNRAMNTKPVDILLGPLLSTFRETFPDRDVPTISLEGHGRELIDITKDQQSPEPHDVVGWFTTTYPLHVHGITPESDPIQTTALVKDLRAKISRGGRPFFAHHHLTENGDQKYSHIHPVEILVNFIGGSMQQADEQDDSPVQVERRITNKGTAGVDPAARRWALIDIEIEISSQGSLLVHFLLHKKMTHMESVKAWIRSYEKALRQTATSLIGAPQIPTLSDYPLLDMELESLRHLAVNILPRYGVQSVGEIENILPANSFQRFSIDGHTDTPPRQWVRYFFDVPDNASVSLERLETTCRLLVDHFSILRTIFVEHDGQLLQVVLRSLPPIFDVVRVEDGDVDLENVMQEVFSKDMESLPSIGDPFVRFMVIQHQGKTRLLLRLSHAQFDGFSRTAFVSAMAAFYDGRDADPAINFSDVIKLTRSTRKEGYEYWRSTLAGSQPTQCFKIISPAPFEDCGRHIVEGQVESFGATSSHGFTQATLFNAACAMLIRSLSGSSDLVFARMTSARAALPLELQNVVGPCADMVPVRVQFRQDDDYSETHRLYELLQQIQKQAVEMIPHEAVGLDNIIQECTNWSIPMSRFPIVTQYHNLEQGSEASTSTGGSFHAYLWNPENAVPYSLFLGAFPSETGVRLIAMANSMYVERVFIEKVYALLCDMIETLSRLEQKGGE